jgi:hypothetical protein
VHDVQRRQLRVGGHEYGRDDGEVLGHVVGDAEGGEGAAGDEQLFADLDDLEELGRVGVQVHHVAGFFGRRRAGVHRHPDVGLRQGWRIVGAIPTHRHQLALGLLVADELEFVLRGRLRQEVVDAGFRRDGCRRQRVIAGDHDGADARPPQLGKALADATLDDVFEVDDPQQAAVLGHDQGCPARLGDALHDGVQFRGRSIRTAASLGDKGQDRIGRPLADLMPVDIDAAHAGLRRKGDESRLALGHLAPAQPMLLLRQHHDGAPLGGFIAQRRQLGGIGELRLAHPGQGHELGRHPVA